MKCKKCGVNLFTRESLVDFDEENQKIVRYNYCIGCGTFYALDGTELFINRTSQLAEADRDSSASRN